MSRTEIFTNTKPQKVTYSIFDHCVKRAIEILGIGKGLNKFICQRKQPHCENHGTANAPIELVFSEGEGGVLNLTYAQTNQSNFSQFFFGTIIR